MVHLISPAAFKTITAEKKTAEKRSFANESKTVFDKYSITERFEDIMNTLRALYFKIEFAEQKKAKPNKALALRMHKKRLYLADIQQRQIKNFSIDQLETAINKNLLPELKALQKKYPSL